METQNPIRIKIQELLNEEISIFILKGKGDCNYAYYLETISGGKYIIKQGREIKGFEPQNSLIIEARVAQKLYASELSLPTPRVIFFCENPEMYCYEYIEGDLLRDVWTFIGEKERIDLCHNLGLFHVEIGKRISKDSAHDLGIRVDESKGLHPEVLEEYTKILERLDVPYDFKALARKAKKIFDTTTKDSVFQFIHNDSHHENIIVKNKRISGIIDFGNAEYGEIAREFSRYIRDFPQYFKYIVESYEEASGKELSRNRLITNAFLSGLMEIVEDYHRGGEYRKKAEDMVKIYKDLIETPQYFHDDSGQI